MTTRVTTTLTAAQVRGRIATIRKRVSSNYEHETAMECIRHAYNDGCGDITLFASLIKALLGPSGKRRGGLDMIRWGREHFPVVIETDTSDNLRVSLKKGRSEGDWGFDEGNEHPFDEATKAEKDAVIFDTSALLAIVTKFSNRDNTTPEAHALSKKMVGVINESMGRTPEATQVAAEAQAAA